MSFLQGGLLCSWYLKQPPIKRGMDWDLGVSGCKVLHIGWIHNKVLQYSTGNYIQYPVINQTGKEYEKECVSVYN